MLVFREDIYIYIFFWQLTFFNDPLLSKFTSIWLKWILFSPENSVWKVWASLTEPELNPPVAIFQADRGAQREPGPSKPSETESEPVRSFVVGKWWKMGMGITHPNPIGHVKTVKRNIFLEWFRWQICSSWLHEDFVLDWWFGKKLVFFFAQKYHRDKARWPTDWWTPTKLVPVVRELHKQKQ